jgi:DNA-binding response OmpR family regulator
MIKKLKHRGNKIMTNEKILVVDDERTVCNSINKILSRKGYTVDKSLNAEEAMLKINKNKYDLIITDMRMPKVSGIELLEIIKDYYPELEVVLITGYPSIDSAVKAMKLGASDYLAKPFTPDELIVIAERALKKRRANLNKSLRAEKKDEEKIVYSSGLIGDEEKDFNEDINKEPSDIVDVDMPFKESDIINFTSKEYVKSLTHSDIPISSKYEGFKKQKKIIPKKQRKDKKKLADVDFENLPERVIPSKEIIDIDLPYRYSDVERIAGPDYVNALDHTDIPRAALYARDFSKKNLILVIGDPIVNRILTGILPKGSFAIESAPDEKAALNKMKFNEYDIIFLNLNKSKLSNTNALNKIIDKNPDVPVVIVSGRDSVDKAVDAMKTGAFHYINKPFTIEEFRNVTKEALTA